MKETQTIIMKRSEKSLDPQLWHACAGGMVQMPPVNSKVFYFPQGHAEHAQAHVDFSAPVRIPALILCRVARIKYMADPETDEVFAKIGLVPSESNELFAPDDGSVDSDGSENPEKPSSFAKTLTQSSISSENSWATTINPKVMKFSRKQPQHPFYLKPINCFHRQNPITPPSTENPKSS